MTTTNPNQHAHTNRLARESSPYLLQHQHNPVDWWPWGDEAFAEARRRDVPIFLSIGYSTCYWCHVMERESFEHEPTAQLMNEHFVCIKVDREERPAVDDLYMAAVQAFTERGGWPMSVFLEPQSLKPFWAGTYFPRDPGRHSMPSFSQVLLGIARAWKDQRSDVEHQAEQLAEAVAERVAQIHAPRPVGRSSVQDAAATLLKLFDRVHGGFGRGGPKFPQPVFLDFLLDLRDAGIDDQTRSAVDAALRITLDKMALGGMFDQIAGGFHRYSVDERWLVPHFEKMLYDNGLLASTYARAAAAFSDPFFAQVARRTSQWAITEMRPAASETNSTRRAFWSALDAEVNHREGQNYLWTLDQIKAAIPDLADADFAARVYSVTDGPNFRDPHHPDDEPANVLFLAARPDALAPRFALSESEFADRLHRVNALLLAARAQRDQPGTDDKVLAAWNGLMIAGLACSGRLLNRPDFVAAAREAAEFVLATMWSQDAGLDRSWRTGSTRKIPAVLEDYAFLAHGLLELARAHTDFDRARWVGAARLLVEQAESRFADPDTGAYFDTPPDQSDLFLRARSTHDGAVPSGWSVMIHNLLDLHELTAEPAWLARAVRATEAAGSSIADSPVAAINFTRALLRIMSRADAHAVARDLLVRAEAADTAASASPAETPAQPVEVYASVDKLVLSASEPAGLVLRVVIAPGFHVNAAVPGDAAANAGLVPFRVSLINGSGARVYADYPPGTPFASDPELLVYQGEFTVPVVVERHGDWSGTPLLAITYQACTDSACLAPSRLELDVSLERL